MFFVFLPCHTNTFVFKMSENNKENIFECEKWGFVLWRPQVKKKCYALEY